MQLQEMLKKYLFHQKKRRNTEEIKTSIIKWNTAKLSKLLDGLKELQNYDCEVFLCPPQKYTEAQPTF